ncbi:MAG: zinc-ribbon domain containing protein [Thermosediminibacteraceae bacterium]|nr:zinc-ribbon domain containing protein [Thermosediminibacteraceae bacterium]
MAFQDKVLVCKDCGKEFVFTAGEQEFYAQKGFENEPSRCKACRDARKASRRDFGGRRTQRTLYDAVCADCGAATKVPFKPRNDRPVYCSECFKKHKVASES